MDDGFKEIGDCKTVADCNASIDWVIRNKPADPTRTLWMAMMADKVDSLS